MRAALIQEKLANLVIANVPTPEPSGGQVRIKVAYAALNHRDLWIKKGQYGKVSLPIQPGSDGAGVVDKLGEGVTHLKVGQEVVINPSLNWGEKQAYFGTDFNILGSPSKGCLADYVVVDAANVYSKPPHLNLDEAAALPLAGLTAYRALFSRANLVAGENVLITGVGGGAALFGLQFALAAGAKVWVTTSKADKLQRAQEMGATGGALYSEEGWDQKLKELVPNGFDVVMDSAGGRGIAILPGICAPGARIVFFGGTAGPWDAMPPQSLFWKQISLMGTTMGSPQDFEAMLAFVAEHKLMPEVDQVFSLDEINEAFDHMEASAQMGKIVIKVS